MKKIPVSTYRLQFNKDFNFNCAIEIFDYLQNLGISDIYASPVWYARKGSLHGYDVVEPAEINPELGSSAEFDIFRKEIKNHGFGWLQDIVPNHMAYDSENQMLIDLLENGQNSRYYNFFDIDWNHPHASMRSRVLAPFLGKLYKECLESGEIQLKYDEKGFSVNYYENKLPVKMESYAGILSFGLNNLVSILGRKNPDIIRYLGVVYFLRSLPSSEEIDERYYQIMFVKEILWGLYSHNEIIRASLDKTLEALNGKPGDPSSFNLLDNILREQNYRLCYWKVAVEEINYRRFFNINELISLRMEEEEVFKRTHSLISKLVKEKDISGLRIDHVDGLYTPAAYLKKLKEINEDLYIIVEKILAPDENLPENWPVDGTTGYEYINNLNGLFVNPANKKRFTSIYQRYIKKLLHSEDMAHDKKRLIIRARMAGEVEKLAYLIESISSTDRYGIDITMLGLKAALEEILTFFPVYRTYISRNDYSEQDRKYIDYVIETVKKNNPRYSNEISYIGSILRMEYHEFNSERQSELALDFIMKFQQLTGPLMAKGFEDTALYVYNRFISLNEVGGEPGRFGVEPEEFHNFIIKRKKNWQYSMNSASTHDTKRGEDVRARMNVLSEIPDEWENKVIFWNKINRKHKTLVNQVNAPDRNDEYFFYQTVTGAFPFDLTELSSFRDRMKAYIIKAVREAKIHTAWIKPDENYENAFTGFVEAVLFDGSKFLEDFIPFVKKVSYYGVFNSVSQTIIRFLSPGVPDIYQGSELWNLSLVDPDNRRPVDYDFRKSLFNEIFTDNNDGNLIGRLLDNPESGKIKMYVIHKLLDERNKNRKLYCEGYYSPVYAEGKCWKKVIGFSREYNGRRAVILVSRFLTDVIEYGSSYTPDVWKGTNILINKEEKFRDIFTNKEITLDDGTDLSLIFKTVPFAVLVNN